jgi:hypothetical protein
MMDLVQPRERKQMAAAVSIKINWVAWALLLVTVGVLILI